MVSLCIKKIMAVWSLCLLGCISDVPEPDLPKVVGCPKWFVIVKNQGLPVCGGALITHVMVISSCECVCAQYEEFIIRRPVAQFTIMIETTGTELKVDMIVPHPMCELSKTSEFPKYGTAMIKTAWGISLDPKEIMPAPLFTLMLESLFTQFERLLSRPSVKCGVMVKPHSSFGSSAKAKCKYQSGVMAYLDAKIHQPAECHQYCHQAENASFCPHDLVDQDLYCLRVLNGAAKSSDPIQGTPLICEDRTWGLMFHFHHDLENIYFFYGIKSVVEIYSMAVTFSIGSDCGGNKIVITKMRSRKAGSANILSSSALITVFLAILCKNLGRN